MAKDFQDIPDVAIEFVRKSFSAANDKVSRTVALHPSMHEETLDHLLILELETTPATFFAKERIGVSVEAHWLGGRRMFERWEIADIAFFVLLRKQGELVARKVALLQTKRLYSKEISVLQLEEADYQIGIGRIADRTEPLTPLSAQRQFGFNDMSIYGALRAGAEQVARIEEYMCQHNYPVYYGLYNPVTVPFATLYPLTAGDLVASENVFGTRVLPALMVHEALKRISKGAAPSVSDVKQPELLDPGDAMSNWGWRLEHFIADEVLRCRQGRRFDDSHDPNLRALLYERSAPISAAVTITIDTE